MRRLNLNHRPVFAYTLAALLCGASLGATAQTTTTTTPAPKTTVTPAVKHVPLPVKPQPPVKPPVKQQVATPVPPATAQTGAAAPAVAKPATTGSFFAPASSAQAGAAKTAVPVTAKPTATGTFFAPAHTTSPSAANVVATQPAATGNTVVNNAVVSNTAVAPTTVPATASKPSIWQNFMSGAGGGGSTSSAGASSAGGSSVGADSANRSVGSNGFASGQGRFDYYDHSVVAYGCLRSDTRVFCDFDQFKQSPAQVNAQSAFSNTKLVLSGGRIVGTTRSVFVDTDGSQYYTAQMGPTTGVRLMLEYDDVPTTQNVAILSFNNKEIQNVSITPMTLQANGNPAPRGVTSQQTAVAPGQQQVAATDSTAATATPQGAADKVNNAAANVQNQRSKWGSVLGNLKSVTAKPQ